MLEQQLTRPEEELEQEEEEMAEDNVTFLDALKGLEVVRMYILICLILKKVLLYGASNWNMKWRERERKKKLHLVTG